MSERWYQEEAVAAIFKAIARAGVNPLVGLPCGTGKSWVIAKLLRQALTAYPMVRAIVSINSKKLVSQNTKALINHWEFAPVGIYCDGLDGVDGINGRETNQPITIGTIQSMANNAEAFGFVNLLIIDEVQVVSPKEETQYQGFISKLKEKNPQLVVIGLSATLYRSKGGMLIDHGLFNEVCYDITDWQNFNRLVKEGYLVPLTSTATKFSYDVSGIKTSGDDFNQKALAESVNTDDNNRRVILEALQRGVGRKHWLFFCAGTQHVDDVVTILKELGLNAAGAHSKMPGTEADDNIDAYCKGEIMMLVSDSMLVVGFDAPFTDHIVVMRPSKAVVRHVQGLGRGTRPWYAPGYDLDTIEGRLAAIEASGRVDCLISDFGRNLERLGPINDPLIPGKRKKSGILAIKICRTDKLISPHIGCGEYNFTAARECWKCHAPFMFEEKEDKLEKEASKAVAVRLPKPQCEWLPVDGHEYEIFRRAGHMPTMRATYSYGMNRYSELVSLEHEKPFVNKMGRDWWRKRGIEPLATLEDTMQFKDLLPMPMWILVEFNGNYPRIVQHCFENEHPPLYENPKENEE